MVRSFWNSFLLQLPSQEVAHYHLPSIWIFFGSMQVWINQERNFFALIHFGIASGIHQLCTTFFLMLCLDLSTNLERCTVFYACWKTFLYEWAIIKVHFKNRAFGAVVIMKVSSPLWGLVHETMKKENLSWLWTIKIPFLPKKKPTATFLSSSMCVYNWEMISIFA